MTLITKTRFCSLWASAFLIMVVPMITASAYAAEKTVARVGDTVITEADLRDALDRYVPSGAFHGSIDRSQKDEYRVAALNDIIETELLYREARKRDIKPSEEAVEAVIQQNIKQFGSEEKMNKAMEQRGFTLDILRDQIRKHDMAAAVLKELAAQSTCTDEELQKYYEENRAKYRRPDALHLYHILIKVDPGASEDVWQEKKKLAEQLLEKIRAGEDFGIIAYQYSEDPYKFKSGDLGFVHRGRLSPQELEEAAFSLKEGEVSGVIRTIHGFHILKAGEKEVGGTKSFEEVKSRLRKELEKARYEENKKALIERLKKEYPVEISLELPQGNNGR